MALVIKGSNAFRTATRHFVHALNSRLESFDRDLKFAKDQEEVHSSRDKLDEAYPEDFFSRNKEDLKRVDEVAEKVENSDLSPRYMALEVQQAITSALMKMEAQLAEATGFNKKIDALLSEKLLELFSLASVTTFVDQSSTRRAEKLQSLIEDNLTPNQFAGTIGFSDFRLKDFQEKTARIVLIEYDKYDEVGEASEFDAIAYCESALDATVMEEYREVLRDIAERVFEQNESYQQLLDKIDAVSDKLYDKSLKKVVEIVEAELNVPVA